MVKKAKEASPNHLLRAARKERNWTQKEVADHIGAPQSFNVSRWEQGTAFPSTHYVQRLCLLFGKSARDLGLWVEELDESNQPSIEADSLPLWNVPFARNPFFIGRGPLLNRLHEQLSRSHNAALNQSYALSGLGGIGKTQTAIEYTYRYRDEYRAVFWVRAASRETLLADYVALARLLSIPGQDTPDQMQIVAAIKCWLEQHERWLLILDNADELSLLNDFLPTGGQGHLLLTTRAQATGKIAQSLSVEKMEVSEGMRLLLRRAKLLAPEEPLDNVSDVVCTATQQLVQELDGLPLALDQAGAYIEETGCSLSEYLSLYQRHRLVLLQRQSSISTDYPHTVVSTWALSFAQVQQQSLAAADLLRLCAFLDPDAIPEEMVTEGAAELGPVLSPVAANSLQLNEVIQLLRHYSLIKRDPDAKLLNIHRLVQVVLRDGMDDQMQRQWVERAIRVVNHILPDPEVIANWPLCQRYIVHAQICAAHIEEWNLTFAESAQLLNRAGIYLQKHARYPEAEPLLLRSLAIREQALEPGHLDVAHTLTFLGELYTEWGKYYLAEPLLQRALTIREQALGPDHLDIAHTLTILALLTWSQGRFKQTESLLHRVLAIRELALGADHVEVSQDLINLAVLYNDQGKYEQAEPLYQRALAIREQQLGSQHPDTATSLSNLGTFYRDLGKFSQAEALYRRALALREQVLGPEHPRVALSYSALALIYFRQGMYFQAEPLYQRALAIQEKMLAPEHLETAKSCYFLARICSVQGRYEKARSLILRALTIREKVLGPKHPESIETRVSYNDLLLKMKQSAEVAKIDGSGTASHEGG